jgi:membrane-bound lytic murein transglycosylase MltF
LQVFRLTSFIIRMKPLVQFVLGVLVLGTSLLASAADVAVLRNGFSICHERREIVGSVTRLYLGSDTNGYVDVRTDDIDHFEVDLSVPAAAHRSQSVDEVVNAVSGRHHLDPDLINSVIHAESGFNPRAVSPKGAQGLMQLMPQTASRLGVANSFDPGDNLEGGTRYLRELLERYNFDLIKALAAYNAGPGRVEQYHGVPPYYETQAYVARIIRDFNRKKLAERKAIASKSSGSQKSHTQRSPTVKQTASLDTTQQDSR